ncbi:MAG TPA: pyridoxal-phosphate dependent enzyme, partial [Acidimicrobiales bacterium]|nr:pyridoxal-phosphate dependent enzyme [Acidimicrobiales bacterium]
SVKDRPAIAMIDEAERAGLLQPGGTIIEPTSGNTGVGLAIVAAQRGYRCVFVMTDKVAAEKVALLRAYGAEVVVCPVAVAPDDPRSYYSTAERLVTETPGAFRPNQYFNPVNPLAHERTTGPEIWDQTDGRITHFVAGAGTGGTISGVGRYLKAQNPDVRIIAADPEGSVYSGGSGRPYLVEGVGEDFWPPTYDPSVVDEVIAVSDADSFAMARRAAREEGLLIGGSCGTAVVAALRVAERAGPDDLVVVLIPDSGRGYLSKIFDDDWMASFGFLRADGPTVGDVISAKVGGVPPLVYVEPDDTAREAVRRMHEHGLSQLPVANGEMPLAAAEVMGAVDELRLMERAFTSAGVLDQPVQDLMGPPLPTIGAGQPVEAAVAMLDSAPALLVLDGGRPRTVISRADVLTYLSPDAG